MVLTIARKSFIVQAPGQENEEKEIQPHFLILNWLCLHSQSVSDSNRLLSCFVLSLVPWAA
jgi:hypothetical protein